METARNYGALAAGAGLILLIAALLAACRPTPERTPAGRPSHLPAVEAVEARTQIWPETLEAFGNIVAWEEMLVGAQVTGQPLAEVHVNVGDRVWRGQLLARFDAELLRAELWRLYAEVEQAKAEAAQADAERERALLLGDRGGVSGQEVLARVTAAKVAAARLSAAQAQLAAQELAVERALVRAPDAGTVSARAAQPGLVGMPGLELFRILRHDRLEWRGELTAAQLARVAPGQEVQLALHGGATARARLRQLAPALRPETRLALVYADLEPDGPARAGTYAGGRIRLGDSAALVVPAAALLVRDGDSVLFKLHTFPDNPAQGRVRLQPVETGRRLGAEVEILAGLREGERVVAQGAGFLDDGDRVRLAPAEPP